MRTKSSMNLHEKSTQLEKQGRQAPPLLHSCFCLLADEEEVGVLRLGTLCREHDGRDLLYGLPRVDLASMLAVWYFQCNLYPSASADVTEFQYLAVYTVEGLHGPIQSLEERDDSLPVDRKQPQLILQPLGLLGCPFHCGGRFPTAHGRRIIADRLEPAEFLDLLPDAVCLHVQALDL